MSILTHDHKLYIWRDDTLRFPHAIASAYQQTLTSAGLADQAKELLADLASQGSIIGGEGECDANTHFMARFWGSAARPTFTLAAPFPDLTSISDDLLTLLTTGKVSILDVGCAGGAGSAALVSAILELRSNGVLPNLPLEIDIFGIDISEQSLNLFGRLFSEMQSSLLHHSIHISTRTRKWDAGDIDDTAAAADWWLLEHRPADEYLILVNTVSGTEAIFQSMKQSALSFYARLHSRRRMMLWLEPTSNRAKSLIRKLFNELKSLFSKDENLEVDGYSRVCALSPVNMKVFKFGCRVVECRRRGAK